MTRPRVCPHFVFAQCSVVGGWCAQISTPRCAASVFLVARLDSAAHVLCAGRLMACVPDRFPTDPLKWAVKWVCVCLYYQAMECAVWPLPPSALWWFPAQWRLSLEPPIAIAACVLSHFCFGHFFFDR